MATAVGIEAEATAVEAVHVPAALWMAAMAAMALSYLMFSENGAVLTQHWGLVHEFFHDGRHVFGVSCH